MNLFDLRFLRAARLSPDGRHVVYGVSRTDSEERFEIFISDLGADPRQRHPVRLDFPGNATAPRWSPDGSAIAFVGNDRLHVAAFPSLRVSEALTPESLAARGAPSWSPDSSHIAIALVEKRSADGARRIARSTFRADGFGFLDDFQQRIYAVDVGRARRAPLRCLSERERFCSHPQWSPSGQEILFLSCDDVIPFASYSQRLLTVAVDTGIIETVLARPWYVESARWLPGGTRIAVSGAPDERLTIPVASLWVIDRRTRSADLRTPDLAANVGLRINHDMPARELTGENPFIILDENTAYATVQKGGCGEIWRIALEGAVSVERVLDGARSCIVLDAHRESNHLIFATTDLCEPTELNCAALDGSGEHRLTDLNTSVLSQWTAMRVEPFSVNSADGLALDAWFMAAVDAPMPMPTVQFIHAGPFAATGQAFRYDFHLLASRGFGIVLANFRGSAGYGRPFAEAIMGDWGGRGFADHMAAIDCAIARGYADPTRLGVWGPSHGGFATCWIVGHTDRFKAAVAEASITDFASLYFTTDAPAVLARDLGGKPHEIPERYRACSPVTYAHRCTTPTLLIHGEDDRRCPIAQAEAFHRALHEAGCRVELVRIPQCSHSGDSIGPLSARAAQNETLIEWFERYL